jgi:hypothetical protein
LDASLMLVLSFPGRTIRELADEDTPPPVIKEKPRSGAGVREKSGSGSMTPAKDKKDMYLTKRLLEVSTPEIAGPWELELGPCSLFFDCSAPGLLSYSPF